MRTIQELGKAVAEHRHLLRLKQGYVANMAGISQECLSRFERGRASELGSRKLLAILDVPGMELNLQLKTNDNIETAQVDLLMSSNHAN